jgi:hypothetical protein
MNGSVVDIPFDGVGCLVQVPVDTVAPPAVLMLAVQTLLDQPNPPLEFAKALVDHVVTALASRVSMASTRVCGSAVLGVVMFGLSRDGNCSCS